VILKAFSFNFGYKSGYITAPSIFNYQLLESTPEMVIGAVPLKAPSLKGRDLGMDRSPANIFPIIRSRFMLAWHHHIEMQQRE
jgi:hypothetical protein